MAAKELVVSATDWIFGNLEVLHGNPALKELLREDGDVYDAVMKGIGRSMRDWKLKKQKET